jgi:hypothetical protein
MFGKGGIPIGVLIPIKGYYMDFVSSVVFLWVNVLHVAKWVASPCFLGNIDGSE